MDADHKKNKIQITYTDQWNNDTIEMEMNKLCNQPDYITCNNPGIKPYTQTYLADNSSTRIL